MGELTKKQRVVYDALKELNDEGVQPTVRSLADRMETRTHESERFSDGEIRSMLDRLKDQNAVAQHGQDPVRWVALDD